MKSLLATFACTLCWAVLNAGGLDWKSGKGYRSAVLSISAPGKTGFTLLSGTGIQFTNTLTYENALANQNLLNGSGVAAGDFDKDGLCDLFFCNKNGRCALYRNLGNFKFEDVTEKAGVIVSNQNATGAVFCDVNGDGLLDLLITSNGRTNQLFLNAGSGHFTNATISAGIGLRAGSTSMALADVDGNGSLDLYVANYGENTVLRGGGTPTVSYVNGKPQFTGRYRNRLKMIDGQMIELGEADVLYLNDGKGHFKAASWTDGTFLDEDGKPLRSAPLDMGLSVMFRDINGDGYPDLYVCNDFQTPDRIWLNDGKGHFRAIPRPAFRSTSQFSMGVDFADINRDGLDDCFVVDMLSGVHRLRMTQMGATNSPIAFTGEAKLDRPQNRRNTLFLNRGDGTFTEIGQYAHLDASEWSWCPVFLDVDLDGYEDVLVVNGHAYDTQDMDTIARNKSLGAQAQQKNSLSSFPPLRTPNLVFRNGGDLTFQEMGKAWGFDSQEVSHGICLADLDNDGDLDVIINCLNAPPLIYRNEGPGGRVAVRLKGLPPNTSGIGAKIKLSRGAVPTQSQEMIAGGRYLSGDDPIRTFATGKSTSGMALEVRWRSGKRSLIENVEANRIYEVDETGAAEASRIQPEIPHPLFQDASSSLNHVHHDEPFDDFARQPSLPKSLAQLGPGLLWGDLSGSGHADLLVGSGKGGTVGYFKNDGMGHFKPATENWVANRVARDETSLIAFRTASNSTTLVIGQSNYEDIEPGAPAAVSVSFPDGKVAQGVEFPEVKGAGPIAAADYDGDGVIDLFIGARVDRYPVAGSSAFYRRSGGQWKKDVINSATVATAGMVSGAIFSDLNGDGKPDLILACEWGPVRLFLNENGKFREATREFGLDRWTGWWNSVAVGDFDGDGRMDIVAGNWGLNTGYRATEEHPALLYYLDVIGNGNPAMVEAYDELTPGKIAPRRGLNELASSLPWIQEKFPTHKSYSMATVNDLLGEHASQAKILKTTTLASMIFLNRGDHFEAHPLPAEAQFAPAFGLCVGDFDGDGQEDLFLAQNFFEAQPWTGRADGGRGLLLRGDGKGGFSPLTGSQSGIVIYEEQRGAAVADFDEDGRLDLAVGLNSGLTHLYHNQTGNPGLRVRLLGPSGNPDAIGAIVRLGASGQWGPATEIHAGGGYWSQDSFVKVLAAKGKSHIAVTWPGGAKTTSELPNAAKEITVGTDGKVAVIR